MQTPKRKTMPRKGAGGRATHDVGGLEFGAMAQADGASYLGVFGQ